MYGGRRHKWTRFFTNMPVLEKHLSRTCRGNAVCDGSGLEHLSFEPKVVNEQITEFPTEPEAEYPEDLCAELAAGVWEQLEAMTLAGELKSFDFHFTEIFSGPRSPFTQAVRRYQGRSSSTLATDDLDGESVSGDQGRSPSYSPTRAGDNAGVTGC